MNGIKEEVAAEDWKGKQLCRQSQDKTIPTLINLAEHDDTREFRLRVPINLGVEEEDA